MTTTTRVEQKKAKARFVAIYSVSLVLVFIVMSAFWQKFADAPVKQSSAPAPEREAYFMEFDLLLHQRMEQLDKAYANYIDNRRSGVNDNGAALLAARNAYSKTLDSVQQQASYLSEGVKKNVMTQVAGKFRQSYEQRENAFNNILNLPRQSAVPQTVAAANPPDDNTETDRLKQLLLEKDNRIALLEKQAQESAARPATGNDAQWQKQVDDRNRQIASLQTQLKQKDAALQNASAQSRPSTTAGGGEWQQKYLSLKASFDKVAASEKSLKSAYQSVADDNRRLLIQLQSTRKG